METPSASRSLTGRASEANLATLTPRIVGRCQDPSVRAPNVRLAAGDGLTEPRDELASAEAELDADGALDLSNICFRQLAGELHQPLLGHRGELVGHGFVLAVMERDVGLTRIQSAALLVSGTTWTRLR